MTAEDQPFGRLLRRLRVKMGITQEELANRAGISTRTVSDVERGLRSAVYTDTAHRLAAALRLEDHERAEFESAARANRRLRRVDGIAIEPNDHRIDSIPLQITPLVGRQHDLDIALSAVRAPDVRLVTLTGPGGIGKTRLAIEAARRAIPDFEDGTFFVSLATVTDPGIVAATIAHTLGVKAIHEPVSDALKHHLRGRHALLVLDTFEHVLGAAGLVSDLLSESAGLTILVTSRAVLQLRGEHEIGLSPLDLPVDSGLPQVGDLDRYSAVALFMQRARAVKPDLQLNEESGPIVVEICRRVDGLPLAIELAAARVKHLSLAALLQQLEHRLSVLTGGPRDLPLRHQTMRDTLSWSYTLLEQPAQQLFRQLSIFAGGWTLEASAFVCVAGIEGRNVLEMTSTLVDKSLLSLVNDRDVVPRYRMLDVIHEYATERRDSLVETDALARRHADYFLRLVEDAEPAFAGTAQNEWLQRVDTEIDNLRAALKWSTARGETEVALRLSGALWQFWRLRGDVNEGRTWLNTALSLDEGGNALMRHKALWGAAWLAYHQADYEHSLSLGEELLDSARDTGDRMGERNGLTIVGKIATAEQRYADAVALFEEALAICRELGADWHMATSVFNLGTAHLLNGSQVRGEALFDQALAAYQELGDAHFTATVVGYLAYPALLRRDTDRAASLTATSLAMSLEARDNWAIADALTRVSAVQAARRRAGLAARIAGAAEALRQTFSMRLLPEDEAMIGPHLENARIEMGESAWDVAWEQGRSMSPADAVSLAIGEFTLEEIEDLPAR